jgi:predicted DNA-binding transcriptional regulator AlpA
MIQSNEVPGVMRAKAAAAFLGIGLSTFWRWAAEGKIPRGLRLSARCTVWKREELEKVLDQASGQGGL